MNSRTGRTPAVHASFQLIPDDEVVYGTIASSYTFFHTGDIMSIVRKSDSEVMIWFEGRLLVPNPCLSRLKTIDTRTKLVVISSTAGARLTTDNKPTVFSVLTIRLGCSHSSRLPSD